jgi:hypothetical protein
LNFQTPHRQKSLPREEVNELRSRLLQPNPGVVITEKNNPVPVESRQATKRSMSESLEGVEAPAKKNKQLRAASSPAAAPPKENAG